MNRKKTRNNEEVTYCQPNCENSKNTRTPTLHSITQLQYLSYPIGNFPVALYDGFGTALHLTGFDKMLLLASAQ